MASHHAIAATSSAIKQLLENAAPASEWSGAAFELFQASDLQNPFEGTRPKVSVYLHRVLLSSVRCDSTPRVGPDGARFRPSLPLDLHYLVTAWASDARTAQQLLGWAIRVLDDSPVIPSGVLNAYQAGFDVFGADETVELTWHPLSVSDLNDIWQVSAQHQSPSASYIARMVELTSDVEVGEGTPVRTRHFDYAAGPA